MMCDLLQAPDVLVVGNGQILFQEGVAHDLWFRGPVAREEMQ